MRKINEFVSIPRVLCVLICLLLIYGLWCPLISYSGIAKAAEKISTEIPYSYTSSLWESIALVLDAEMDETLLEGLSEYNWRQLRITNQSADSLEDRIYDLYDYYVWGILDDYFYDDDIYDYYYDEYNSIGFLNFFRNSTVKEALIIATIITIADEYTYDSGIESVIELEDCLDKLQNIAGTLSDRRISAIELCDFINATYIAARYIDVSYSDSIIYAKQALADGTADQYDLRILAIENSIPFLFAAKIIWPGLLICFSVLSLLCIYYAVTGKRKNGFGLSIALLVINAIVFVAVMFVCLKSNLALTELFEDMMGLSLTTINLFHPALGSLVVLLLSIALTADTKNIVATPGKSLSFKKVSFSSDKTWKCVCGNVSSIEHQYCVRCGQKKPEPTAFVHTSINRCKRCGTELLPDSSFCISCGAKIDVPPQRSYPSTAPVSSVKIRMGASFAQSNVDVKSNIGMRTSIEDNKPLSSAFKKPNSLVSSPSESDANVKTEADDAIEFVRAESDDNIQDDAIDFVRAESDDNIQVENELKPL